jgi:hypothetical protein
MPTPIGWRRPASVRSVHLDCLGAEPFLYENPLLWALDFLGIPWILSSESSLFNGLRGIFAEIFFPALSFLVEPPERASRSQAKRKD